MRAGIILAIVFTALCNVLAFWVAGSAVTSLVKAATEQCDQTYMVEVVLAGDWLCPVQEGQ